MNLCCVTSRHPDPDKTPRAAPGLRTCAGHRRKVERMIAELPGLFADLGRALTAAERLAERVSSSAIPGLTLNGSVIAARDEIHAELVRLARKVSEERGFTVPGDDVTRMAAWLLRHVEWLCAQADADETHDYLDALHGHKSLAFPSGRRHFALGVICGAPLACDVFARTTFHCEGRLVAYLMPYDDREQLSEVACDTCGLEVPLIAAAMPQRWQQGKVA